MKRPIVIALALALLAMAGYGAPRPIPQKLSSDDCLVIIRILANETAVSYKVRTYSLMVKDGDGRLSTVSVPFDSKGFVLVRIRDPGAKVFAVVSKVTREGASGAPTMDLVIRSLPYVANGIALADFAFSQDLSLKSANESVSSYDLPSLSEDELAEIRKEFAALGSEAEVWLSEEIPK